MTSVAEIAKRLEQVNQKIARALENSGRAGDPVTLVTVSKTFPAENLSAAISAGASDIGESKVQEFEEKKPEVEGNARWHLIGHLQRNKVKKALPLFDMIQSVDSYKLAKEIDKRAEKPFQVLIQVNCSGEDSKFGLPLADAQDEILKMAELPKLDIRGIMTIGPLTDDESRIRASYSATRELFESMKQYQQENLKMEILSMGMSGDFELAIAEGATMVRVGSAVFGPRNYNG
jgi:hypothetical protein